MDFQRFFCNAALSVSILIIRNYSPLVSNMTMMFQKQNLTKQFALFSIVFSGLNKSQSSADQSTAFTVVLLLTNTRRHALCVASRTLNFGSRRRFSSAQYRCASVHSVESEQHTTVSRVEERSRLWAATCRVRLDISLLLLGRLSLLCCCCFPHFTQQSAIEIFALGLLAALCALVVIYILTVYIMHNIHFNATFSAE